MFPRLLLLTVDSFKSLPHHSAEAGNETEGIPGLRLPDAHNYDLAINAALGRETCVKMILDAAAAKEKTLG